MVHEKLEFYYRKCFEQDHKKVVCRAEGKKMSEKVQDPMKH